MCGSNGPMQDQCPRLRICISPCLTLSFMTDIDVIVYTLWHGEFIRLCSGLHAPCLPVSQSPSLPVSRSLSLPVSQRGWTPLNISFTSILAVKGITTTSSHILRDQWWLSGGPTLPAFQFSHDVFMLWLPLSHLGHTNKYSVWLNL